MIRLIGDVIAVAFVAVAIAVLYGIVRFSIVSRARLAGAQQRLRHPIADDLDGGTYFVTVTGAVVLRSRDVLHGEIQVARDIISFARFHATNEPPTE